MGPAAQAECDNSLRKCPGGSSLLTRLSPSRRIGRKDQAAPLHSFVTQPKRYGLAPVAVGRRGLEQLNEARADWDSAGTRNSSYG